MNFFARPRQLAGLLAMVSLIAASTAVWLFPRAFPIVALEQSLTRDDALARADSFFRAHDLAPAGARTAVHFQGNDSLRTFVELAGGGADSLNALVRGRDVAPFSWSVRAFVPRDVHEARVELAPDGRIIGFSRHLAEADARPAITADSGQRLAERALGGWIADRMDRWRLVTSSYETRKTSGRIDRSYTFERTDRRIAGAPVRAEVVVGGDQPTRVRQYVEIPESFRRRYGEMRSANDLLALLAGLGALAIAIAGIVFLSRGTKSQGIRWREAAFVGAVIGVLTLGAGVNELPASWYDYDTAMSPTAFQARVILGALLVGGLTGVLAGFTLAAAEAATRQAFPDQLDWWKLWRYRGTREVAGRVAGGYVVATIGFAYVAVFYLVTRRLLGWWVPGEVLDDPNLIATPVPWMSGIAVSLNAGVWEETLFRALPLSLLSMWVGRRPRRRWWMAGGVVVTALVFGFAHANYASWPPYSRGVEIFLDACFWAVLVLNFGVLVTVIAHFVYDLVLFGLFTTSGSAPEYRISAAIIGLALLAPALAVLWKWARQGALTVAPADARFGAWTHVVRDEPEPEAPVAPATSALSATSRRLAIAAGVIAAIAAVAGPSQPTLGPRFTADREFATRVADSLLASRGGTAAGWRRLIGTGSDTLAPWPRFLREHKLVSRAQELASTYVPPAWWVVRYVHTTGTTAQRAEEWRVRVWPDGRPLDVRHLIPDSAARRAVGTDSVRLIALRALARDGVDTARLREAELKEKALPSRRDVTITYTDTTVKLPAGAVARAWVHVAGDEPLVARRGVELPESFIRSDRERQTSRALIGGLCGLILAAAIVLGAVQVTRRRPVVLHDAILDRRRTFIFLGALVACALLGDLNSLPSALFSYDTAEPWSRFVGTTAVGFVSAIPLSLALLGLWLALDALRCRVGIPMRGAEPSRGVSEDAFVAALGLGGLAFAVSRLGDLVPATGIPRPPSTLLSEAIPAFGRLSSLPSGTIVTVALLGIPILVVAGITRSWPKRAAILAVLVVLLVAASAAMAPAAELDVGRLALAVGAIALVAIALRAWGAVSALSWIVAALVQQGFSGLRAAFHAPVAQERIGGVLLAGCAVALIALVVRHARAAGKSPPPLDALTTMT